MSNIENATSAVWVDSEKPPESAIKVEGWNFEDLGDSLEAFIGKFKSAGFQATHLGRAVDEINRMLEWRLSDEPIEENADETEKDEEYRKSVKCKIWLSYTSNMISSGLREVFVFLAKHKLVDYVVTTAGGIEEDLIKALCSTYIGDFHLRGDTLRDKGWNRIGNLIVPNNNYVLFSDWLLPVLDEMKVKQDETGINWTPSKMNALLGERIENESSFLYWCNKNEIPVFCPGITDGSLGDNMFFHAYKNPGLRVDIVEDIKRVNDLALFCKKSGIVILGGGLPKHHTCNANLMRNGADFAVYVNTGQEYDGSDSGASPDEAISWGKIRQEAFPVKVHCDATIAFPMIAAGSFLKYWRKTQTK